MRQALLAGILVFATMMGQSVADEMNQPALAGSASDASTLRLYFAPAIANAKRGRDFEPEIARLLVDGEFVGDAIVNLAGHLPTLNIGAGPHKIRVEMDADRVFEAKITLLGRGSIQYLVVNFDSKTVAEKP